MRVMENTVVTDACMGSSIDGIPEHTRRHSVVQTGEGRGGDK